MSFSLPGSEELGSSEESGKDWDELEEEARRGIKHGGELRIRMRNYPEQNNITKSDNY